jgi:phage terminase Nu1 subunit (DNA packaging protein)
VTDISAVLTQTEFGELVGVSQRAVSELLSRGVIAEGDNGGAWLLAYCDHLRTVAAGRAASGDLDLATERARLARAQAIRVETANAVAARELAPAYLIEQVLAKAGAKAASIFDAIPGHVKRRVPTLPASALDLIRGEIAKARNIAAAVSLNDLIEIEEPLDPDDDTEGNEAIDVPADSETSTPTVLVHGGSPEPC